MSLHGMYSFTRDVISLLTVALLDPPFKGFFSIMLYQATSSSELHVTSAIFSGRVHRMNFLDVLFSVFLKLITAKPVSVIYRS